MPSSKLRPIIEKLEDTVQNNPSNHSIQNILSEIKSIKNDMTKSQLETSQNFSQQFSDFKREYINDLRLNLTSNVSDKIEPLIKEQIQILFQKTEELIKKQFSFPRIFSVVKLIVKVHYF